jgi:probable HAF family extracellular repeat protein
MPIYTYITLDDPSAGGFQRGTNAIGINASGQIVGTFTNDSGRHGFLYSGGVYTTLDDPSAFGPNGTVATGINASGQIVGDIYNASNQIEGFLYSGGTYTTLNDPGHEGHRGNRYQRCGPDRRRIF